MKAVEVITLLAKFNEGEFKDAQIRPKEPPEAFRLTVHGHSDIVNLVPSGLPDHPTNQTLDQTIHILAKNAVKQKIAAMIKQPGMTDGEVEKIAGKIYYTNAFKLGRI